MSSLRPVPVPKTEPKTEPDNFFSLYLEYTGDTESPTFYHRWTALTCLAAWVGRDVHVPFGHFKIHSNMYTMLVGLAGTKKSTAIKIGAKLLKAAGYTKFAAKKTRQEKFLMDMVEEQELQSEEEDILDKNIFGVEDFDSMEPAEVFVAADEVNNFIGVGNLDFMSLLGELWDIDEPFQYRLKNSKSITIPYPTITLLGGNTFVGFNKLFPPEATEQGFFSRMLFIYAEPVGRKHTIPPEPDEDIKLQLIKCLHEIKNKVHGRVEMTAEAYTLLDRIYMSWAGMEDIRFDSYENRRIVHLLKIALLTMAARVDTTITKGDIIEANTILSYTEHLMPKALGEFGKGRNSEVTHKVMQLLDTTDKALSLREIWRHVHQDLEKRDQLIELLGNLALAEKIQMVEQGYLPIKAVRESGLAGTVDWTLLTPEERDLL